LKCILYVFAVHTELIIIFSAGYVDGFSALHVNVYHSFDHVGATASAVDVPYAPVYTTSVSIVS
jgi:hypothetical protein